MFMSYTRNLSVNELNNIATLNEFSHKYLYLVKIVYS